ncbi:MAG: hypothetical protein HN704_00205 [Bacteroidetes bacterium]|nr:hypothetical protein [Bacteroidota bacterium]MBT7490006.1 hypothetical protein [Bacteroidota bacterium]
MDNIYLTGTYSEYYDFGNVFLPGYTYWDAFVVKYNPQGVSQWALGTYGSSQDQSYDICVGPENNLYITGFMISPYVVFGNDTIFNTNGVNSYSDLFVAKLIPPENLIDTQQINLQFGWNIMSSYINPLENSIDSVFSEVSPMVEIMKNDIGQIYYPLWNINVIDTLQVTEGYHIKMNLPQILNVIGISVEPENTAINLSTGWQTISYLRQSPAAIDSMFTNISSNTIITKNNEGLIFWPQYNINSIWQMNPGEGYQIKMQNADTLLYLPN